MTRKCGKSSRPSGRPSPFALNLGHPGASSASPSPSKGSFVGKELTNRSLTSKPPSDSLQVPPLLSDSQQSTGHSLRPGLFCQCGPRADRVVVREGPGSRPAPRAARREAVGSACGFRADGPERSPLLRALTESADALQSKEGLKLSALMEGPRLARVEIKSVPARRGEPRPVDRVRRAVVTGHRAAGAVAPRAHHEPGRPRSAPRPP